MDKLIEKVFTDLLNNEVIKNANMRFLINDRGIADEYFKLLKLTFKQAGKLKDSESQYIMAYMSWGAGAYFTSAQWALGKTIDTFTDSEIDALFTALFKDDAIGLGYDSMGILGGSYNYNKITNAIKSAYGIATELNPGLEALLQVFFNIGVTMAYDKFEK